jgi:Protein of unknown function (DUF1329)
MNRRQFGLLAGTSLATAAMIRPGRAQSVAADPTLLTTTLTPYGAERAGNADGSIPAWTGGLVSPPLPPTQPADVQLLPFSNEASLYEVNANNLAQYQDLVSPGLQRMISKFGYSLKVFPTHRTAAAPQYVYDNMAKNVTRAKLDPAGGRLGFSGGYGGIPFPIIDTSDPLIGGAQLIWNHLTHFEGFQSHVSMSPAMVVSNKKPTISGGGNAQFIYPYYDPNGSLETYAGYYSKLHGVSLVPESAVGQESLTWHSTNVSLHPDMTWTLVNGEGRVRKAPNEAYDTPVGGYDGIVNIDESQVFYGNPSQYDWNYITKKEMLVAYNNNHLHNVPIGNYVLPDGPDPSVTRWEKHRVWVVEATLHPGIHNVLSRRRFYIDEDTGQALLGESYDGDGNMVRAYVVATRVTPSIPMVNPMYIMSFDVNTSNYVVQGQFSYQSYLSTTYVGPNDPSLFQPQEMAANASF